MFLPTLEQMRLIQIARGTERRVGVVNGDSVSLLEESATRDIYSLAMKATNKKKSLTSLVEESLSQTNFSYAPLYEGKSEWRLLPSFDHPSELARCLVSGTGLTHKASAQNRSAMHKQSEAQITDSARMYQMGLEGGSPASGQIGVQPEWFYKGNGSVLRAHGEELEVPAFACDGGEEPEVAGVYIISTEGNPVRVGLTVGNEFSDHEMEKKNYLYLAPSKLRVCAIGPELHIGPFDFQDLPGIVSIYRKDAVLWEKRVWTGEKNMSHSVANLEHHHFKYPQHRRPGDAHVHFFGADAFSFGEGVALQTSDVMEVSFMQLGSPLRNPLRISERPEALVSVPVL
jgi:hypothetical protein